MEFHSTATVEKFAQFVAENRTAEADAVLQTKRLPQEVYCFTAQKYRKLFYLFVQPMSIPGQSHLNKL